MRKKEEGMPSKQRRLLSDKRIFVAGGTGKIGTALIQACVLEGAKVVFSFMRSENRAREIYRTFGTLKPIQLDIRDYTDVERAKNLAISELCDIDGIVNMAGIWKKENLDKAGLCDIRDVIDTNLMGSINIVRAFLPHFKERKGGSIVLFGSSRINMEILSSSFYGASKMGIMGFMKALSSEISSYGIRINVIAPGYILSGGRAEEIMANIPSCAPISLPFAHPRHVADVCSFLLSDMSCYITGQFVEMDTRKIAPISSKKKDARS